MALKNLKVSWHAFAFIDVLGQSEELAKFQRLPLDQDLANNPEFLALLKTTYKRVHDLHDRIDTTMQSFRNGIGGGVAPEHREYWKKLTSYKTTVTHFSDGILLDLPLVLEKEVLTAHGIVGLIACCANIMILELAAKTPLRGGLDVGHGAQVGFNVSYGPGIAGAHYLESSVAQYPRIVIGQEALRYLHACETMTTEQAKETAFVTKPDLYAALTRSAAEVAKGLILQDVDGNAIVHYLSPFVLNGLPNDVARMLVRAAYDFVKEQAEHRRQLRDSKLAFRYAHLLAYFQHSLPALHEIVGDIE